MKICTSALSFAFTICFFIHPPIATFADYPHQDKAVFSKILLKGNGWCGRNNCMVLILFIRKQIYCIIGVS